MGCLGIFREFLDIFSAFGRLGDPSAWPGFGTRGGGKHPILRWSLGTGRRGGGEFVGSGVLPCAKDMAYLANG